MRRREMAWFAGAISSANVAAFKPPPSSSLCLVAEISQAHGRALRARDQ
jgi:hypothetical protein